MYRGHRSGANAIGERRNTTVQSQILFFLYFPYLPVVVENVGVPRQSSPHLSGIYYITPTNESVQALLADFSKRGTPQYKAVHVFFSSPVDPALLQAIRGCQRLVERLVTLKEVNLEYVLLPDHRSFTTSQDSALQAFFGASIDSSDEYRDEVGIMATRLATVFVTLKEFPSIRYRAALPPGEEYPAGLESRLLVAQRLAVELYEALAELQRAGKIPERETCELIITDRGFDPVAPIIHEWTYEAMLHDLLEGTDSLHGKIYTYNTQTQDGKNEPKDHILDERDSMFVDLRHRHFAAATMRITSALDDLRSKSRLASRSSSLGELDLRSMGKLVQALPQYRDQLAQLSVHVEVASSLNRAIDTHRLTDLGKLEQDLVYGDATSKELISFLSSNQMLPAADKVRALMCYAATHQEKLDPSRQAQWQKVARLSGAEMAVITNLEYLGVPVCKRQRGGLAGISFGRRRRRAVRKDREADEDEQQFALSRFVPVLSEVIEDASGGRLSQEEYPYVRPPGSPTVSGSASGFGAGSVSLSDSGGGPGSTDSTPKAGVASFRTVKATGTWAKKAATGYSGTPGERSGQADSSGGRGNRIFAFVIGGFTFSELRVAHRMSARLGRDVMLGGTSVVTPALFMRQVLELTPEREASTFEIESSGTAAGSTGRKW